MLADKEILSEIKAAVQEAVPDARVYLFGSRVRGDWHEESDWDILILTGKKVNFALKDNVHKVLYPVSLETNEFINHLVINEDEWLNKPSYYALHKTATPDLIPL